MHGFHGLRHYGATAPSGPVNGRSHKGAPQPIPRPPSIPILPPARPPRRSAIAQPVGLPGRPRWSTRSAYNYHYFGHPFAFGQSVVASGIALSKTGSADLWQSSWRKSLPGLLFSPAPGLVWFSPVLVLGLVSAAAVWRDPRFRALIPLQLGTVLLILVAGKWFDWWGGLSWGYRSIVDVAPFLALLTVPIIDRIVASRPLLVLCGVLLAWSIAVQFLGAYSYSLMGWSDLWREYDRPEQASLWRWDRPQIGYHLAHFSSERARKKQVMATYLNYPGPILNVPTKASGSTLGSH